MLTKSVIASAIFATISVSAFADTTATLGAVSQYFVRGYVQTPNTSAYARLDSNYGNASFGVWTADVGDGLEVDLYGLYGVELDNGLSLSAGWTGYYYTGEFDDTWEEFRFFASYNIVSFEYSVGIHDDAAADDGEYNYDYSAVTLAKNGFYGKYGKHGKDFAGSFFEFGYGTEISGFDVEVALISIDDDLARFDRENGDKGSETLTFSLSKSFSL